MSASSQDGILMTHRVIRRLAFRRLIMNLAMVGGYTALLCNPSFDTFGDWKLLLGLPVEISLFLAAVDCLEIYGGPLLFFYDKWYWIARWRPLARRVLAVLLLLCVFVFGASAVFIHTK
jgi:hypothetical protein